MSTTPKGWIGVDLDGTLAEYGEWQGPEHIGRPVAAMVLRVRRWLAKGEDVRIFTARVGPGNTMKEALLVRTAIDKWCLEHLGAKLPVTATKDYMMRELWGDRCVQVVPNTGRRADGKVDL